MNFLEIVKVNMRNSVHGRGLPARTALCILLFHSSGKAGGPSRRPGEGRKRRTLLAPSIVFLTFFIVTPGWLCYKNRGEKAA